MTIQTVRPGSLEKLRAMQNDPPREARVNQPAAQLEGLELDLTALEDLRETARHAALCTIKIALQ